MENSKPVSTLTEDVSKVIKAIENSDLFEKQEMSQSDRAILIGFGSSHAPITKKTTLED